MHSIGFHLLADLKSFRPANHVTETGIFTLSVAKYETPLSLDYLWSWIGHRTS